MSCWDSEALYRPHRAVVMSRSMGAVEALERTFPEIPVPWTHSSVHVNEAWEGPPSRLLMGHFGPEPFLTATDWGGGQVLRDTLASIRQVQELIVDAGHDPDRRLKVVVLAWQSVDTDAASQESIKAMRRAARDGTWTVIFYGQVGPAC